MSGPAPEESAPDEPVPRPRRRRAFFAVVGILLLALLLSLRWVSQPSTLASLMLDRAGAALGLEISASGASEYRLRGTPMLEVRDLVVRQHGAKTPLLIASRAHLSLPWSTIRARGSDLTLVRVELDAPRLDLAALQAWQATRPPSQEVRIPTLADGMRINNGRLTGTGWAVAQLNLELPSLHPGQPLRARVQGRYLSEVVTVPFDLQVALTAPDPQAGMAAVGMMSTQASTWRLPMHVTLAGRGYSGAQGVGLDDFRFAARARYVADATALPFVIGLGGRARYLDGRLAVDPLGLDLRGEGLVPPLAGTGRFVLADSMALQLQGALAQWPESWPTLPQPLGQSTSPLPFVLDYRGTSDLSGLTALQLSRDATRFDGQFRLPAILGWMDASAPGTPLPPLEGTLTTPGLDISGAVLEGVEIQFEDGTSSSSAPAPSTPAP